MSELKKKPRPYEAAKRDSEYFNERAKENEKIENKPAAVPAPPAPPADPPPAKPSVGGNG